MLVRKLSKEDLAACSFVSSVAFEFPYDPTESVDWDERVKKQDDAPHSRGDQFWRERWGAFTDDGELMGGIGTMPYPLRYNGHIITMSGIGGVSTLPPYRRQGVVRACFEKAFVDMYEKGHIVSMLYPFSDYFYRQFGYENCIRVKHWEIPMTALRPFRAGGKIEMLRCGGDTAPFEKVFNGVTERYDLACPRETIDWQLLKKLNPSKDRVYAYLWHNDGGEPKGYIVFTKDRQPDGTTVMNCVPGFNCAFDFQFVDAEGLMGLLDFVQTFASDYQKLRVVLPYDMDIEPFISMHNFITVRQGFRSMLRAVDSKRILELSAYRGSGSARIAIADRMCPWNDGTWQVDFTGGKAVTVEKTEEAPDISMDAHDFSRLIFGSHDMDEIWLFRNVRVTGDQKELAKVFYRKKTWIAEQF